MSKARRFAWLAALLVGPYLSAAASPVQFSSGDRRVTLIELFTSEGCSSCPPADRWVSGLKTDPGLWKTFVPIAFHVDYWDYIGWSDRFARPAYSERQRRYATEGQARFVYTPGFFRNGQEWRGWRHGKAPAAGQTGAGSLSLRINDKEVIALFTPGDANHGDLTLHIAVLGMNQETRVRAGENRDKTLRHDFVVLGMNRAPLEPADSGYRAVAQLPLTSPQPGELAIAGWVTETGAQLPMQSVGGYLPAR